MFTFGSIRTHCGVVTCFVRWIRSRARKQRDSDPGIGYQRKLFPEIIPTEAQNVPFDELEADFSSLGMSHMEHVREIEAMHEKEKYLIVKQKYFKEKHPNFLTWADKQQIRYLHGKDPEEWSLEKLAEGFPALPEIIKKIVKSHWSKSGEGKIRNHDESVRCNWENFKNGKLELPRHMAEHLNKFTSRTPNYTVLPETNEEKPRVCLPQGEFSEIITSYEKLKSKKSHKSSEEIVDNRTVNKFKPQKETYISENQKTMTIKAMMPFSEYKRQLEKSVEGGTDASSVDKLILREENEQRSDVGTADEIKLNMVKYVGSTGQLTTFNAKNYYGHLDYPEKIIIPKGKRRTGSTYKLNDCYYDDDGEFLYRVPGME